MKMYIELADNEKTVENWVLQFQKKKMMTERKRERVRERERERYRTNTGKVRKKVSKKVFLFIMKGHWQILSSCQTTVNYARDDLQIQLPFVSRKDDWGGILYWHQEQSTIRMSKTNLGRYVNKNDTTHRYAISSIIYSKVMIPNIKIYKDHYLAIFR